MQTARKWSDIRSNVLRQARVWSRYPLPGVADLLDEGASLVWSQFTLS
jgi:hypothetical protein